LHGLANQNDVTNQNWIIKKNILKIYFTKQQKSMTQYDGVQSQSNEPMVTKDSRTAVLFVVIFTFFWDVIFCNILLKIHISFSIHHIFCINFS
jgi:hypothetical protein